MVLVPGSEVVGAGPEGGGAQPGEGTILRHLHTEEGSVCTICPRICVPVYIVTCYMKWGNTSLKYSKHLGASPEIELGNLYLVCQKKYPDFF